MAAALKSKQNDLCITNGRRVSENGVILETFPEDAAKIKHQQARLKIDTPKKKRV